MWSLVALTLVLISAPTQAETVFHGRPAVKIQEDGVDRIAQELSAEQAAGFECIISRIGDGYYWPSRENRALTRYDGPGYTTYVAEGGAGYIKVVKPEVKPVLGALKPAEAAFDYLEHMALGLTTLTYYGSVRSPK